MILFRWHSLKTLPVTKPFVMLAQAQDFKYSFENCFPSLNVTIVDSLNKRITFLTELVNQLGLANVSLYHDRAETFGQKAEFRGAFDYVTARAVARLNVLSELCLPLVKKKAIFSLKSIEK